MDYKPQMKTWPLEAIATQAIWISKLDSLTVVIVVSATTLIFKCFKTYHCTLIVLANIHHSTPATLTVVEKNHQHPCFILLAKKTESVTCF